MNKILNVSYDLDGVIGEFSKHFLQYLDFKDQTPATDWNDLRFRENFHKVADDYKFWLTMPLLNTPIDIYEKVHSFCTARPISSYISKQWLDDNKFPDVPVYTVGHDGSKVEILQKIETDLFLDDGFHNFEELNDNGILTFLYTRSHNIKYKTALRVNNMTEFNEIIFKYLNK